MAVFFAVDRRVDMYRSAVLALYETYDLDARTVRHLVFRKQQYFFADDVGGNISYGRIGKIIAVVQLFAFRKELNYRIHDDIEAVFLQRRNRYDIFKIVFTCQSRYPLQQRLFRDRVDLINKRYRRLPSCPDQFGDLSVRAQEGPVGRVAHIDNCVNAFERFFRGFGHQFPEFVLRRIDSRGVNKYDLVVVGAEYRPHIRARRLRSRRSDSDLLSQKRIYKCGFSDVRSSDYRNESCLMVHNSS